MPAVFAVTDVLLVQKTFAVSVYGTEAAIAAFICACRRLSAQTIVCSNKTAAPFSTAADIAGGRPKTAIVWL